MVASRFMGAAQGAPRINEQTRTALSSAGPAFGDLFSRVTESFGQTEKGAFGNLSTGAGKAPRVQTVGSFGTPISSLLTSMRDSFSQVDPGLFDRGPAGRPSVYQLQQQLQGQNATFGQGLPGGTGSPVGVAGHTGTMADDANAELSAASAQWGVPVNFLKTVLIRESSGNWARDGNRMWWGRPESGGLLPYVGIFENTWRSWGCPGSAQGALGNKAAQIDCMARGARLLYDKAKAQSPQYDWRNVFSMYFSGRWEPIGWRDENGLSDYDYVNNAMQDMQRFDAMSGSSGAVTPPMAPGGFGTAGGGGAISSIWGGQGERDLSYGFNAPNSLGLYSYGASYGMDGRGHTGIDIPGTLNEPARTPVGGTVVCGSTGNGPGAGGSGCSAFNDVMGSGAGRIEVQLDNGHTLIFGHMSQSHVRPGQRVNAGDIIGTFGGMNGAHVHLEYRIPDASTPSGWRIVDPAQYLNGAPMVGSQMAGQMGAQPQQMAYNPDVPVQGWGGRTLTQTRMAQTPYVSSMMSRYR